MPKEDDLISLTKGNYLINLPKESEITKIKENSVKIMHSVRMNGNIEQPREECTLTYIQTNCESIRNKLPEFKHMVEYEKPDMIFLVETWCQPNNMERKDNTDNVRGGILMYFHKSLDVFNCDELNNFSRNVECHFMWA